jgi:hypothetical protein
MQARKLKITAQQAARIIVNARPHRFGNRSNRANSGNSQHEGG